MQQKHRQVFFSLLHRFTERKELVRVLGAWPSLLAQGYTEIRLRGAKEWKKKKIQNLSVEHKGIHEGKRYSSLSGKLQCLSSCLGNVAKNRSQSINCCSPASGSYLALWNSPTCSHFQLLGASKARPMHAGMQTSMHACHVNPGPPLSTLLLLSSFFQ